MRLEHEAHSFALELFGLSEFAMEVALFEASLYRDFTGLDANVRLPYRGSILRLRHQQEKYNLAKQFLETVNAMFKDHGPLLYRGMRPGKRRRLDGWGCIHAGTPVARFLCTNHGFESMDGLESFAVFLPVPHHVY